MPTDISPLADGLVVRMPSAAQYVILFGLPGGGADQAGGDLD